MKTAVMELASGTTLCPTDTTLAPCDNSRMIDLDGAENAAKRKKCTLFDLLTLPPLPSPLLCPCMRSTFLVALILSLKLLQDHCYSNRAWLGSLLSLIWLERALAFPNTLLGILWFAGLGLLANLGFGSFGRYWALASILTRGGRG